MPSGRRAHAAANVLAWAAACGAPPPEAELCVRKIGGERRVRPIQAGSSYMSSSPPVARFGLCQGEVVDRVALRAPDGGYGAAEHAGAGGLELQLGPAP